MPRVTLFIDSLCSGGAQTQIVRTAASLAELGWQVRLAWYNHRDRFMAVPPGVLPVPLPRNSRTDPRFAWHLAQLVSGKQTDLVHAWLPSPALYAVLAARLPGSAPVVAAMRCAPGLFDDHPSQGQAAVWACRWAAAVTSNSRAMLPWLAQKGVAPQRLHFVGNALDPAIARRSPSPPAARAAALQALGVDPGQAPIVALGRFDAFKNQDGLVRALGLLRREGMALPPLVLAGPPAEPDRVARVQALARDLALDVHIVPPVKDVATLLEAARCSVLASHSEGTPNVVLEALDLATVVVATRVGEVPELVRDGDTGFLCPPRDDAELAAALARALRQTDADAKAMGQRAQADVRQRFSAQQVATAYDRVYRSVLI